MNRTERRRRTSAPLRNARKRSNERRDARVSRRVGHLIATGLPALIVAFASACASVTRPPSADHVELARKGEASVVLLRLLVTDEGRPRRNLRGYGNPAVQWGKPYALRVAGLDASTPPRTVHPAVSPSAPAKADGWIYLVLAPGSYWLSVVLPGAVPDSLPVARFSTVPPLSGNYGLLHRGEFTPVPAYHLDVRRGEPVLYAGTIHWPVDALRGERRPENPASVPIDILNETEAARGISHRDLTPLGLNDLHARLLTPYGRPLPPGETHGLSPAGLATAATRTLDKPDLHRRAMNLWMTPSVVLLSGLSGGGGGGSGVGELAVLALALAYAPIGLVGGWIHGTISHIKWRATLAGLERELEEMEPDAELEDRLEESCAGHFRTTPIDAASLAGGFPAPPPGSVRSLLLAIITRVRLREGSDGGTFLVEVGFRVRLWDVQDRAWRYDRAFVYTEFDPEDRIPLERPYETVLLDSAPACPLSGYRDAAGRARFRGEIERAIELLIAELRHDFGLMRQLSPYSR